MFFFQTSRRTVIETTTTIVVVEVAINIFLYSESAMFTDRARTPYTSDIVEPSCLSRLRNDWDVTPTNSTQLLPVRDINSKLCALLIFTQTVRHTRQLTEATPATCTSTAPAHPHSVERPEQADRLTQ